MTRARQKKKHTIPVVIFFGIALFATGAVVAGSAANGSSESPSRLVSVQQLPSGPNDACMWDGSADAHVNASALSPEERILFSALQGHPSSVLIAAAQRQRESSFPHA